MLYSDEETKREEALFQQKLLDAGAYVVENKERIEQHHVYMNTVVLPLMRKKNLTDEERELIETNYAIANEIGEKMHELQEIFAESLTRQAAHFMDVAKQNAAEGVEGAQEAYEDLKASYVGIVESSISKN